MKIFFRFNCGNMWGLGHLYRNITLIKEMTRRGAECEVIINDHKVAQEILEKAHIPLSQVNEYESAEELISAMGGISGNEKKVVFWDRLDSDVPYIRKLAESGVKIITYDDYDPSALFAAECINTRRVRIDNRFPRYSGPAFQILRNDIREYSRKRKVIHQSVSKILLHFGGTDPLRILETCFDATRNLEGCIFEFIGGKEEDPAVEQKIKTSNNATYEQGVSDFGRRLFEADICLVAGGVSMYEAAAIGTPMINICHNKDQEYAAAIFEKSVGSVNLGIASKLTHQEILDVIVSLKDDYERRQDMSQRMKAFVPSDGVERICNIIERVITET